jgi:hypothetical protein
MPHFRHDCLNPHCCRYVGSTAPGDNAGVFDVYAYNVDAIDGQKIIIRFGEDGDYHSGYTDNYRRSVERDPENTIQWGRALEIYDAFFSK